MSHLSYHSIICNKPQLFHYTRAETAMDLLKSKSLLVQPISNFVDKDEYLVGLKLISQKLKDSVIKKSNPLQIDQEVRQIFEKYCGGTIKVIGQVIDHIDYEIRNMQSPMVEVYVACFSTNPSSVDMLKNYGKVIIRFHPLLHLFAYNIPQPFSASMISRVTYDEHEFQSHVVDMINSSIGHKTHYIQSILSPLSPDDCTEDMSAFISEQLCTFAPNIKKPKFSIENEWRLKSIITKHKYRAQFYPSNQKNPESSPFPVSAKATGETPTRYFHELTFEDKFMSQEIMIFLNDGGKLSAEVGLWQEEHSLPVMTQIQIEKLARDLEARRAPFFR